MVTIKEVLVSSYDLASLTVSWSFNEVWEDLSPYYVNIYRCSTNSEYVESDYTCIASGIDPTTTEEYEDTSVSGMLTRKWADVFYTVIPHKLSTSASGVAATPARLETSADLITKEIIRREGIALRSKFGGKKILVLKRKKTGTRCSECWDETIQRRTVENCTTCYDTSWVGGFWQAVEVQASIGPGTRRTMVNLFGEWENQDNFLRVGPKPVLSPQDIVIDIQNRRWRVADVRPIEKGQYILQQQARLVRLDATDVINEYEVTWPS